MLSSANDAMKAKIISMAAILLAIELVGCASRTLDFTYRAKSTTCELHGRQMKAVAVPVLLGNAANPSPEDAASERLFPHSDRPVHTGYCALTRETHARVYVCAGCVKARTRWLEAAEGSQRRPNLTRR